MTQTIPGDQVDWTLKLLSATTEALMSSAPPGLHRVAVRAGDVSLEVEWRPGDPVPVTTAGGPVAAVTQVTVAAPPAATDSDLIHVRAPIVGTFYAAPEPGAAPFVSVGDLVEAGQQVAIVEAMKLMNAVTAPQAGRVVEVLVADAGRVEYDQGLIVLAPVDQS
ncbi:acetyl-CoA carboxylase biotin carboxyl carrier protein [Micromonospora cathayae]|uniref:Biotin carboxyl carrier protein of acetyl-CoA carboxylase n=1 Tax=Micromonospora cathayae TaxID=3028804 RepID=A0ABY7ZHE5_9ACTN|nr:biotin/lipoyl-containing protein [Micromonospora sp. HUAS 3]WDZ82171.1 acetyl-CoA carboxylase biotin carboxyl carrier protein subunit [Micromonospora sp. HUAS 3]